VINRSQDLSSVIVVGSQDFSAFLGDNLGDGLLVEIKFKLSVGIFLDINNMEIVVEHSGHDLVGIRARANGEFVKDAFIFIEFAELSLDRVIDGDVCQRLACISKIPDLDSTKVSSKDVFTISTESSITN